MFEAAGRTHVETVGCIEGPPSRPVDAHHRRCVVVHVAFGSAAYGKTHLLLSGAMPLAPASSCFRPRSVTQILVCTSGTVQVGSPTCAAAQSCGRARARGPSRRRNEADCESEWNLRSIRNCPD
eukprot:72082-Pleurochrysis_carterae.AAC.3